MVAANEARATGLWRRIAGQSRLRFVARHDHQGNRGTGRRAAAAGPDSPPGGRAPRAGGATIRSCRRSWSAGRTADARRPGIAVALDVQEHPYAGGELTAQRHPISHEKVAQLLRRAGLQPARQPQDRRGGRSSGPGRAIPHINEQVRQALARGRPVISVDTKKKELIGNYENQGRQWRKTKIAATGQRPRFSRSRRCRAPIPTASTIWAATRGFVNVGTDHDTGAFAVASIRGWWRSEGRRLYPKARQLLITADGGGSNGIGCACGRWSCRRLADETGLSIPVCHFPPGTSKWNKVEHRLFSFISSNWRGEPLRDYETIVRLIAGDDDGQRADSDLPAGPPAISRRAEESRAKEMAAINLTPDTLPWRMELHHSTQVNISEVVYVIY